MLEMDEKFDTYELEKVKKRPLDLLFFAECVFDNLKKKIADLTNQSSSFGAVKFLIGGEIMVKRLNDQYI